MEITITKTITNTCTTRITLKVASVVNVDLRVECCILNHYNWICGFGMILEYSI